MPFYIEFFKPDTLPFILCKEGSKYLFKSTGYPGESTAWFRTFKEAENVVEMFNEIGIPEGCWCEIVAHGINFIASLSLNDARDVIKNLTA